VFDDNPEQRLEDIRLIVKDLLKVVKVVSLYPENNPLPQSLRRSFAEKFENVIDDYGDIRLTVEKSSLTYASDKVFEDKAKDEALVGLFFDAGILTITFKSGLDVNEIYRFLDIIKLGINATNNTYDLVNGLWEADLPNVSLTTAEDMALADYDGEVNIQEFAQLGSHYADSFGEPREDFQSIFLDQSPDDDDSDYHIEQGQAILDGHDYDDLPVAGSDAHPRTGPIQTSPSQYGTSGHAIVQSSGVRLSGPQGTRITSSRAGYAGPTSSGGPVNVLAGPGIDSDLLKTSEAAAAMGFMSTEPAARPVPDSTLILNDQFCLTEEEETYVQQILKEDAEFEPFESTAELVKEMLHQEDEMTSFYESVGVAERVMTEFIRHGRLAETESILDYMQQLDDQIRPKKPLWAERLKDARTTAGSRDRLKVLVDAVNGMPQLAPSIIKRYLARFGWESLGAITDLLGELIHEPHREAVRTHLSSLGAKNIQIISRGIYDKRSHVVKNAILVLAGIGDDEAYNHLKKAASHADHEVRLELVRALKDSPGDGALGILGTMARDPELVIRQEAVQMIVARRGQVAFDTITDLINDEAFMTIEHKDRETLLVAYSTLGGEHALEYLRRASTQLNLLHSGTIEDLRREAFEALANNGSDKSARLLMKMTGSWRPAVKYNAIAALKRRRELLYGGDDESTD